jgi:hypothetical protein
MLPTRRRTRFIVFFPGRSGGSYLASTLNAHPDVVVTPEPLGIRLLRIGPEGQARWVRRYYGPKPFGPARAIGISTKLTDIADQDWFADLLHRHRTRVVLLSRENDVKRTVSIIRARELRDATGVWNRESNSGTIGPTVVDPAEFAVKLERNRARKLALVDYATGLGLPLLRVDYGDLLIRPEPTFAGIFDHIGVTPRAVEGTTLKNTSDDLRESVANFDELRSCYVGTEYEAMFDEVLPA